jgi:MFS family permease
LLDQVRKELLMRLARVLEPGPGALRSWYRINRVLVWISAIVGINQLGFGSIVPVVPLYAQAYGVSEALIGLAIAVYGLARFTSSAPAGWIADRAGRRWSLFAGGLATVLGNILCALAPPIRFFSSVDSSREAAHRWCSPVGKSCWPISPNQRHAVGRWRSTRLSSCSLSASGRSLVAFWHSMEA